MVKVKSIIKYLLVFLILLCVCIYVNKAFVIKGLYKDDLYNWTGFPGTKFLEFAFGFRSPTRYRPFFNLLQYFEYTFVGHSPIRFSYVNYAINTLLALFVFYFAEKLKAGNIISAIVAILYLFSHFAYYQIGQAFGLLETEAQFFAIIVLFLSFKLVGLIEKKNTIVVTASLIIMYFVTAFTHERYICLAPIVLIALIFARDKDKQKVSVKQKLFTIGFFILDIVALVVLRIIAVGKFLPAGTGGTYVEDTFEFMTAMKNCFIQIAFIFGINTGPEHLVGVEFQAIQNRLVKFLGVGSICFISVVFIIYLIMKIHDKIKQDEVRDSFLPDIMFLLFVIMCIGATSVTIRIEMRFIYASFTACLLYLSYVCGYVFRKEKFLFNILFTVLPLCFFITRIPLEMKYRTYYPKVHCIVDQMMMNSLYDNTIGVYGVDDTLHKKNIYILYNVFEMTDFYAESIYQIYDVENKGNPIHIVKDPSTVNIDYQDDNNIVLIEDLSKNCYVRFKP